MIDGTPATLTAKGFDAVAHRDWEPIHTLGPGTPPMLEEITVPGSKHS